MSFMFCCIRMRRFARKSWKTNSFTSLPVCYFSTRCVRSQSASFLCSNFDQWYFQRFQIKPGTRKRGTFQLSNLQWGEYHIICQWKTNFSRVKQSWDNYTCWTVQAVGGGTCYCVLSFTNGACCAWLSPRPFYQDDWCKNFTINCVLLWWLRMGRRNPKNFEDQDSRPFQRNSIIFYRDRSWTQKRIPKFAQQRIKMSFVFSVLAGLFPQKKHVERPPTYSPYMDQLVYKLPGFPMSLSKIQVLGN